MATEIDREDLDLDDDVPFEKLMAMLGDDSDTAADGVAFGETSDMAAPERDVVSVEQGVDTLDEAAAEKRAESKVALPEGEDTQPAAEKTEEDKPAGEDSQPATDDYTTLLDGLPDDRKGVLRDRLTAADEVLGVFKGREAELQALGVTPVQAMTELVNINAYARRAPDQYIAWAATQFGDAAEVLGKAAEHLGLKVVPIQEDDPFEDPEIKEMKAKLAQYEGQQRIPLGPDAPQHRAQTELEAFTAKAPHFQAVAEEVAARATRHVAKTGQPATIADIKRFYEAEVMAMGLAQAEQPDLPAAQSTPAAQATQPVAQQAQKQSAAPTGDVQRAKAASKSLDGSGQGAGRRPALDPDASIENILNSILPR